MTVEYGVIAASVPCGVALFTCTCGATTVEYDVRRGVPDRWRAAPDGSHLCPGCASDPIDASAGGDVHLPVRNVSDA